MKVCKDCEFDISLDHKACCELVGHSSIHRVACSVTWVYLIKLTTNLLSTQANFRTGHNWFNNYNVHSHSYGPWCSIALLLHLRYAEVAVLFLLSDILFHPGWASANQVAAQLHVANQRCHSGFVQKPDMLQKSLNFNFSYPFVHEKKGKKPEFKLKPDKWHLWLFLHSISTATVQWSTANCISTLNVWILFRKFNKFICFF